MTRVNKKVLSVGVLALSMLVACSCGDTIKSKPTFYDDPILDTQNDLTHNLMSVIYDALSDNSTNKEKVLNAVIDQIALDYFGKYADAKKYSLTSETNAEALAFLNKHEFYKKNTVGKEYTDKEKFLKLQNFVKEIEKRITKSYYDEAASGTYSYRNKFSEEKMVQKLRADLYDIKALTSGNWYSDVLVTENYKTNLTGLIHIDQYEDYTTRYLVSKFYREALIEQYMYTNNYSLLGRSYARKINYVALPINSKYPGAAKNLLIAFANKYVEGDQALGEVSFKVVEEAWRGLNESGVISTQATELLTAAGFEKKTISIDYKGTPISTEYYPATKYGEVVEKYAKITSDRNTTENDADFTGSNTYPKEIGLSLKQEEILLTDFTTDGWFNKNSATDLPDSIKTRLFNIGVANDVDHLGVKQNATTGFVEEEVKTVDYKSGDYVTKKNGNYWLVPTGTQKVDTDKYNYIILENNTYYMVQVNEAVSTSKLSLTENNTSNYAHLRSGNSLRVENSLFSDLSAYEIAKLYNANETYKNNAYSKYIEDSKIMYYDQAIYDYFKEKFPELFD